MILRIITLLKWEIFLDLEWVSIGQFKIDKNIIIILVLDIGSHGDIYKK